MQTTLIIVDEYQIFRNGLKLIIENQKNFKVIGETGSPGELFDILKLRQPDVLLINLGMPKKCALAILSMLKKKYPGLPVIIFPAFSSEPVLRKYIDFGIQGIHWKECSTENLIETISKVVQGERNELIPLTRIKSKIIQYAINKNYKYHDFSALTVREHEILKLLAEGLTYKKIGEKLFISPRTVETHKNNILKKLGLRTLKEMVKYAIKYEIIEL